MKTKFKLLIVLLVTFCATLVCGLITACKDDIDYGDPSKDGYIITVLFPDGSPVTNMDSDDPRYYIPTAELTDMDGNRIAKAEINASGVAQINYYEPGEYYIKLTDYPTGYAFDNTSVKTSADRARYTVSLEMGPPTTYTINLSYPDETPMPNVTVNFMNGTKLVTVVTTDNDGVATTLKIPRGIYDIVLEGLPKGYSYKPVSTTIAAWPMYITAIGATDITFEDEDKLNEAGVAVWDTALNDYALPVIRFDKTADCYVYTADVGAGEEVFFRINAPKTGSYTIGSKSGNDYVIQFYNNDLTYVDTSLTISSASNNGNNIQRMRIEEGKTLTFSVKSESRKAAKVEVLVCLPVPEPETVTATAVGTYTLKFDKFNMAILNFVTSPDGNGFGQGVYKISSDLQNTYDVMIIEYSVTGNPVAGNGDLPEPYTDYSGNDNGAGDGLNFVFTNSFPTSYLGNTIPYHIIIKDAVINYPVEINVTIERTGDAIETQIVTETATAHVDTKYANQTGTFTWMPTNNSVEPYRKADGNWYVQVDGQEKALVVAITKKLSGQAYSFANVEYFGEESGENSEPTATKQNSKLTVYDLDSSTTRWDYANFIKQYEGYVSDDGVYQVNDELKLFLERYMANNFADFTNNKPAQPWLLGCGYYA